MKALQLSRTVRRVHMYLALFLTPWMLAYALSSLLFNHPQIVRDWYDGPPNQFEAIENRSFEPKFSLDLPPKEAAVALLRELDLDGPHNVRGNLQEARLTVTRQGGIATHRIVFFPHEKRLLIEKQKVNGAGLLTRIHLRAGYGQDYLAAKLWAVAVDLTAVAMMFWIASGLWMWWEIRPARKVGALFGFVGIGLFIILLLSA